jgi:outer membrane protein TolC
MSGTSKSIISSTLNPNATRFGAESKVNLTPFYRTLFFLLVQALLIMDPTPARSEGRLTLSGYLNAVKTGNSGYQGNVESAQGAELRSEEVLLQKTTLYSNLTYTSDGKLPSSLLVLYDSQVSQTYSLGVSHLTDFGLTAKFHYDLFYTYYVNPVSLIKIPGVNANLIPLSYAVASPVLELTQNFWSGGFGRTTQALVEQSEASALATSYNSSFQSKSTLVQAELAYWKLAQSRQTIHVQQEALDRARKIYSWNVEKAKLHLRENSDVLQAQALAKRVELQLLTAHNGERTAARAFNTARGISSEEVPETLDEVTAEMITQLQTPKRVAFRDDVKALQCSVRASLAGNVVSKEKDLPTLDVFANLSLNGQTNYVATDISTTIGNSFSHRPTETIGVRFNMPISGVRSKVLEGWQKEHVAAEKSLDQKLFEQEQNWKDLNEALSDRKKELELALNFEEVQKSKLGNERARYKSGRTTTYQVLMFEQDYLEAEMSRIASQVAVLTNFAQLKLFGESL